jgi:hypothetical protein
MQEGGRGVVSRRISDQRSQALSQANAIRERRAALKRRLKGGDESLAALILDPPDYLNTARIETLVMTTPGVGKVRSQHLLRDAGIPRHDDGRPAHRTATRHACLEAARATPLADVPGGCCIGQTVIELKDAGDQGAVTAGAPARPNGAGRPGADRGGGVGPVARRPLVEPIPRLLRDSLQAGVNRRALGNFSEGCRRATARRTGNPSETGGTP